PHCACALLTNILFSLHLPRRPPASPLFPYPTLFRSADAPDATVPPARARAAGDPRPLRHDRSRRRGGEVGERCRLNAPNAPHQKDRKSTRLNSSHVKISYAVFCLKKKKPKDKNSTGL